MNEWICKTCKQINQGWVEYCGRCGNKIIITKKGICKQNTKSLKYKNV